MQEQRTITLGWLLKMAWRDSRKNRSRLLLFISSIILGIAALVAVYSLSDNLRRNVDLQAAALLGADLEISGNKPASDTLVQLLDSIGGTRAEERNFASMILFMKNNGSRLVQIRALGGDFPFYGDLETTPLAAGKAFRRSRQAIIDQTLMLQFEAEHGDSVQIGNLHFSIAGTLNKAPGQTGLSASVAPAVYIPLEYLEQTGLLQKGSRINYKYYIKLPVGIDPAFFNEAFDERIESMGYDLETVASQKEDTGRTFRDLTQFLSLVSFIALLLGCIGVASAIHIYVREKFGMIAILRCLGVTAAQTFLIFLIQIIGVGLVGSMIGAAAGAAIQHFLPVLLKDLLPINIVTTISWPAIWQGIMVGVIISVLFALTPLLAIRKISPLNTLRVSFQAPSRRIDPLRWLVSLLILGFILVFTYIQLGRWEESITWTAGIVLAFLLLSGMASLLMKLVRRFFPESWSYLWRQALSNLFRPNNQTIILIVSIGLGTAFISTLFFVQTILLNRVTLSTEGNQPNMVLFDIQSAQRDSVLSLAREEGLPVNGTVPIVNMRLEKHNGLTLAQVQEDTANQRRTWLFNREYRVTYRDSLTEHEKITDGEWSGTVGADGIARISIEEGYAKRNNIELGDKMLFNVQGALVETVVGSFREVDWNRIQTNFLVVFPAGIIDNAPQFHVLLTRVASPERSARFQQAVVRNYPNISIIDLGLVLRVLDDIFSKIGFIIRFIAGFSILTGLFVLIASVLISKYQRIQESVLLRTLGAVKRQIFIISALEYFFLGALAAGTGILLAFAGSWALAEFTFETTFTPSLLPILILFLVVCSATVAIGLLNIRDVVNRPPLEILRKEL